ncbi:MAG: DsbA family protein [Henriciella sp.]|nr:DsbA family protein [Henriciella sp.]
MTEHVDVYWSFRSPYSYLVTPDLMQLREDFDIDVHLRPVLPIAIRSKDALFTNDRKPAQYIVMDAFRRGDFLGRTINWPTPDPVVQDFATFAVSDDQPYIHRLTGLGVEAERRGKGVELAYHVSHLIWASGQEWDKGDHLAEAVAKAGLDLADMEKTLEGCDPMTDIEANQNALEAAGHWGVPTMVFKGEPFFGQDRIDTLRWRLEKAGLKKT